MQRFIRETEGIFAEWVDGEVIYPVVTERHAAVTKFISFAMSLWAEHYAAGTVYLAPYSMRLDLRGVAGEPAVRRSVREPDVFFVSHESLSRVHQKWVEGPADIAVEVVSPESRTRDRRDKLAEYAAAGVREYWIVDYERRQAEFYRLGDDGYFEPMQVTNGTFRSAILDGLTLPLDWLWQDPNPGALTVIREWNITI